MHKAEFYLVDEDGNRTKTWDYLKEVNQANEILTLQIPSSEKRQSLLFYAVDEAGNESIALPDEKQMPLHFLITTNRWLAFINSSRKKLIAAILVGMTGIMLCLKRKQHRTLGNQSPALSKEIMEN